MNKLFNINTYYIITCYILIVMLVILNIDIFVYTFI